MKELSTKDKAQAYDEALEKARQLCAYPTTKPFINDLQDLFPELKESEDERIRKWIINEIKIKHHNLDEDNVDFVDKAIAWLEKQGEKQQKTQIWKHWKDGIMGNGEGKSIYLIKYGHTYSLSSCLCFECDYIKLSELDNLTLEKQGTSYTKRDVDDAYVEGIAFAKDELEKQDEQKPTQETEPFEAEHSKYYYCIKDYFCGGRKQASKGDVVQALRGLPIMGLKDASEYFLPVNSIKCNSAWSEEDERHLNTTIAYLKDAQEFKKTAEGCIDWLKSLKQRIGGK